MKKILPIISLAAAAVVQPAPAGTLTGTVRAEGKQVESGGDSSGKYDSRKYKFAERINYAELHDFVVYIDGPAGEKAAAPQKLVTVDTRRISQKGAMFSPHVLPVVVGTT